MGVGTSYTSVGKFVREFLSKAAPRKKRNYDFQKCEGIARQKHFIGSKFAFSNGISGFLPASVKAVLRQRFRTSEL